MYIWSFLLPCSLCSSILSTIHSFWLLFAPRFSCPLITIRSPPFLRPEVDLQRPPGVSSIYKQVKVYNARQRLSEFRSTHTRYRIPTTALWNTFLLEHYHHLYHYHCSHSPSPQIVFTAITLLTTATILTAVAPLTAVALVTIAMFGYEGQEFEDPCCL